MKKLLFILLCLPMLYGCQQQAEEYNDNDFIEHDTLNIERIKIQTH